MDREKNQREVREIEQLLIQVKEALDAKSPRDELLQLAYIDAMKYMRMDSSEVANDPLSFVKDETRASVQRRQTRIENIDSELNARQAEKAQLLKTVGPKHYSVVSIESAIESLETRRAHEQEELDKLNDILAVSEEATTSKESAEASTKNRTLDVVKLYATSLVRHRDRLRSHVKLLTEEIENWRKKHRSFPATWPN